MSVNQSTPIIYKKNGRLTKISDNDNDLRSNRIVGYFYAPPIEGFNFTIFSEPLTPGMDHRKVSTSPIVLVEEDNQMIIFQTSYSRYMLEIFEEFPEEFEI